MSSSSSDKSDAFDASPLRGPRLPYQLGRFTLCRELGAGGMATVYLGRMRLAAGIERLVAVKTIHAHLAKDQAFIDMFLDEAKIVSMVSHPNVCSVFDFGSVGGTYYLAMEHLVGEPLFDVVNEMVAQRDETLMRALPFLAARIIADACEGLHAAHSLRGSDGQQLNVVHRDVSPQNLFVTYEGSVKVVDFGCAKALERVTQTNEGLMKGKVSYAAPEQLRAEHMDARVDVFALGVCLWEALTLRQLFRRDTAIKTAMAVLEEPIPRATEGAPWVPPQLAAIADKALARDREARYSSARELGRALRGFIARSSSSFEAAEVADWMQHLFPERHEHVLSLVAEVEGAAEKSKVAVVATGEAPDDEPPPVVAKTPSKSGPKPIASGERSAAERVVARDSQPVDEERLELPTTRTGRYFALLLVGVLLGAGTWAYFRFQSQIHAMLGIGATAHQQAREEPEPPPATESPSSEPASTPAPNAEVAPPSAEERAPEPERAPSVEAASAARGPVSIRTPGGWARVMHDGRAIGRTPLSIELPVGRQQLSLLPFGREPARVVEVDVQPGTVRTVSIRVGAPRRGTEGWENPY